MMAHHLRCPLLEIFYDEHHHGRKLEERVEVLNPLRPHTHTPLEWDDRYAPYLQRAGFLPLATLVKVGLSKMNNATLTALVDRWRLETHTFHLSSDEMTIILEDISMLFELRVDGRAVTGNIKPIGWRDMVHLLLGVCPEDPPQDVKDRKTTRVSLAWLVQHFVIAHPLLLRRELLLGTLVHGCGIWCLGSYSPIVAGTPFLGCGYQSLRKSGRTFELIARVLQLLHGCIVRCVMPVGGLGLMLILVGVPTFSGCRCGSAFQ
nr:uncharacterized protein LOC117841082 [Setaria viridis]